MASAAFVQWGAEGPRALQLREAQQYGLCCGSESAVLHCLASQRRIAWLHLDRCFEGADAQYTVHCCRIHDNRLFTMS